MSEKDNKETTAIKMQKLRRAVGRLRKIRSTSEPPPIRKQSWLARIKAKLGLGGGRDVESEN
jgi:hypothetical protein